MLTLGVALIAAELQLAALYLMKDAPGPLSGLTETLGIFYPVCDVHSWVHRVAVSLVLGQRALGQGHCADAGSPAVCRRPDRRLGQPACHGRCDYGAVVPVDWGGERPLSVDPLGNVS